MERCHKIGCEKEATKEIIRNATIEEAGAGTVFTSEKFSIPATFKENVCDFHYEEDKKRIPPAESGEFI